MNQSFRYLILKVVSIPTIEEIYNIQLIRQPGSGYFRLNSAAEALAPAAAAAAMGFRDGLRFKSRFTARTRWAKNIRIINPPVAGVLVKLCHLAK